MRAPAPSIFSQLKKWWEIAAKNIKRLSSKWLLHWQKTGAQKTKKERKLNRVSKDRLFLLLSGGFIESFIQLLFSGLPIAAVVARCTLKQHNKHSTRWQKETLFKNYSILSLFVFNCCRCHRRHLLGWAINIYIDNRNRLAEANDEEERERDEQGRLLRLWHTQKKEKARTWPETRDENEDAQRKFSVCAQKTVKIHYKLFSFSGEQTKVFLLSLFFCLSWL